MLVHDRRQSRKIRRRQDPPPQVDDDKVKDDDPRAAAARRRAQARAQGLEPSKKAPGEAASEKTPGGVEVEARSGAGQAEQRAKEEEAASGAPAGGGQVGASGASAGGAGLIIPPTSVLGASPLAAVSGLAQGFSPVNLLSQRAIKESQKRMFGEKPEAAVARPMVADVPTQVALNRMWLQTPLGAGSGDYGAMGESFSKQRLEAVANIMTGSSGAVLGSAGSFGASLALQALGNMYLKSGFGVGGLLSMGDAVMSVLSMDVAGIMKRCKRVFDLELWDDDPWGNCADGLHLFSDAIVPVDVTLNLLNTLIQWGGDVIQAELVVVTAGTLGLATPVTGLSIASIEAAQKQVATLLALVAGLRTLALFAASQCRAISVLSMDGDAKHINQALNDMKQELEQSIWGLGLTATRRVSVGGLKAGQPDSPRLRKVPGILVRLSNLVWDAVTMSAPQEVLPSGRVERWVVADKKRHQETSLGGLLIEDHFVTPPIVKPFNELPGAPYEPQQVDEKRVELSSLEGQQDELSLWGPQIEAKEQELEQQKADADAYTGSNQKVLGDLDAVGAELSLTQDARVSAGLGIGSMDEDLQGISDNQAKQRAAMKNLATFINLLSAVPAVLMPDSMAAGLAKAKVAVEGFDPGVGEGSSQHRDEGKARLSAQERDAAQARELEASQRAEAQARIQQGEAARAGVVQHAQELGAQKQTLNKEQQEVGARVESLKQEIAEAESSMNAWASVHEGVAVENDLIADKLLSGAEIVDGEAVTLSDDQKANVQAALSDLDQCTAFCERCIRDGATLNFDNPIKKATLPIPRRDTALAAIAGRSAEGVAQEGLEDIAAIRARLGAVTPADYLEVIAQAFDTTSRIRKRLKPNEVKKKKGDQPPPPPPEPPKPEDASVFFGFNQPTPGEGRGPVLEPERAGTGEASMTRYAKYLAEVPDAELTLVGHASVEGSQDYNLSLAMRRMAFVEREIGTRSQTIPHVEAIAVGEEEAAVANPRGELALASWRRVDMSISPPE